MNIYEIKQTLRWATHKVAWCQKYNRNLEKIPIYQKMIDALEELEKCPIFSEYKIAIKKYEDAMNELSEWNEEKTKDTSKI